MSKKRKKSAFLKQLLIIGSTLAAVEVGYILYYQQGTAPITIRDEIIRKVEQTAGLSTQRREQLKIQLAVNDFRIENGRLPATLDELSPKYFDQIPSDPETSRPFKYEVEGERFYVGEREPLKVAAIVPSHGSTQLSVEEEKTALIASLDDSVHNVSYVYDPIGKREPFKPYDMSPKLSSDSSKTALERYQLGQLKLTAVLAGTEDPTANVENDAGRGFLVRKGTKIGPNNGEVIEILPDRIKVLEKLTDFTGAIKNNVVEMVLRTKEMDENLKRR